ncbi:hypothetical protein AXF42_Ash020608 [Apostasia shenzhenica]|uniref:Uncharacterized protein n=1 Tax=Apostasia shenzhenica TaxID=1088818 RepID=A0A2I0A0H0_9ASPA|nr:hypothetical protein AXF42_Ash020608 [Apostasia shenzhenica]
MSSVCTSAVGCVDVHTRGPPLRSSYINLYKWAESDAEFVRSVAGGSHDRSSLRAGPRVVDSFSCRQMYLRSYTFCKKETVPEKTIKCFGRVTERAADLSFVSHQRRRRSGGSFSTTKVKKKKKKGCSLFCSIFRRLLSCTTSFDVAVAGGRRRFGA